jgi:phosphatidylserine/phosphatidylglycerophosphate/cardiolipin synthase-like enzyme
MAVDLGSLKLFLGPAEILPLGSPASLDDLEAAIVGFIDGALKSLDIAVQEVDSEPIARAIIRAQIGRKVAVRLVSEADYLSLKKPLDDPFLPKLDDENEVNRILHAALLRSKAWVRTDYNPDIFHQKFIIRDKSAVLTGSTNFTKTDTHANLNHVVIVENAEIAKAYQNEFDEIRQGHFGKFNIGTNKTPKEVLVDGVRIKPCFAPDHAPEMEIMKQMLKAKSRIDFAIFTFANSSGIDDTMVKLSNFNIAIRGAMDGGQAAQAWAAGKGLVEAGIGIWRIPKKNKVRKLHHKLMVIDDSVTIVGSFNYTAPANLTNDENIVIIGDLDNPSPGQKQIALAARLEIDRIIADHGIKMSG